MSPVLRKGFQVYCNLLVLWFGEVGFLGLLDEAADGSPWKPAGSNSVASSQLMQLCTTDACSDEMWLR
jgi:hypothetical protein